MKTAFIALALLAFPSWAGELRGTVISIYDGDTITVLDGDFAKHKVRLIGIDAPEKRQAFGQASRQHLASLLFQKEVVIDTAKRDRDGRFVSKIVVDGADVCLSQVAAGFAWHFKAYEKEQAVSDRPLYATAEIDARKSKAGLWVDPNPIPPWEWRKAKRTRNALQATARQKMTQPDARAAVGAL